MPGVVAMVVTISKKLMLSFLGLTLLVLFATLGLARWSFERGFMDYANAVEQVRLQALALSLSQKYVAGDGWSTMPDQRFERLVQITLPPRKPKTTPPPPGPPRNGTGSAEMLSTQSTGLATNSSSRITAQLLLVFFSLAPLFLCRL